MGLNTCLGKDYEAYERRWCPEGAMGFHAGESIQRYEFTISGPDNILMISLVFRAL